MQIFFVTDLVWRPMRVVFFLKGRLLVFLQTSFKLYRLNYTLMYVVSGIKNSLLKEILRSPCSPQNHSVQMLGLHGAPHHHHHGHTSSHGHGLNSPHNHPQNSPHGILSPMGYSPHGFASPQRFSPYASPHRYTSAQCSTPCYANLPLPLYHQLQNVHILHISITNLIYTYIFCILRITQKHNPRQSRAWIPNPLPGNFLKSSWEPVSPKPRDPLTDFIKPEPACPFLSWT